jgi:hypothetical protein
MNAAVLAANVATGPVECDVCALAPCLTLGFCQACRAADAQMQQQRRRADINENPLRLTPRSTIEAIMWCVRERCPPALHEPANIERLSRCDDPAIAEIDARIKKLEGKSCAP